jgi:chromate reductase, NAD(P)H dehydrogenase (quinone)
MELGPTSAAPIHVVALAGSLRSGSYNKGLLRAAVELAPVNVAIEIVDLAPVPLFNQDLEHSLPPAVSRLRTWVADADALLLAAPEYNHTIPGVMGNAVDWLSRRLPTSPLRDKPVALMGAAGGGGSVRAQAALRVPLEHAGAVVLDGPLVALREVSLLASETGDLLDLEARDLVATLMGAFVALIGARSQ